MVDVGIIGGTGYTGKELIRLISKHPRFNLDFATSRSRKGEEISDVHSNLVGFINQKFISPNKVPDCDLVFCAVPHSKAMGYVPSLREREIKVVDLSADYRVPPDVFEEYYDKKHSDPSREAVYGLTELNRELIKESDFVANPGCFPTGALLSILPLLETDNFDPRYVLFDSKTGISGAGADASQTTHFPNVSGEVSPYKLVNHRHNAEIGEILYNRGVKDFGFTPHIVPMTRGIQTTTHILFKEEVGKSEVDFLGLYEEFFSSEEFVNVSESITGGVKSVRGTNYVKVGGFSRDNDNRVVLLSFLDNLVKGAAGQGIQNANLMMDLDESLGLEEPGLSP